MILKIKINEVLEKQNKSKYWLSKQTGMTAQNVGKLVNGQTASVRFENLDAICKALNCEISDILEYEQNKRD